MSPVSRPGSLVALTRAATIGFTAVAEAAELSDFPTDAETGGPKVSVPLIDTCSATTRMRGEFSSRSSRYSHFRLRAFIQPEVRFS